MNALLALLVVVAAQDAQPVSEGPPAPSADSAPATGAVDDTAPAAPQADAPQPDAPQADAPQADAQPGGAQQGDAPPAQAPPAQAPPGATPTPAAPAGPAQTRWEPVDEEVESIATGMLGVCETLILPISIIPAVGEYVGLAAEWACIVPAAFAVQHTALHHGDRAPHLWQIFIALGMQKLWQTIVALPVPFVLVSAATTGLVLGGLAQIFGAPVGITVGLLIAPLTVAYLVSKGLEKEGGRFIFSRMYDLFDEGLRNDEHATAARESWIGPRQDGVAGVVYLVATADGASAPFEPQFLIPVVGPILKAQREAETTRARMRRAGLEVLGERKDDLAGMDTMADVLAGGEALFMAVGHAGLIASFSMLGASLVLLQNGDRDNAEMFGAFGAIGAVLAASFVAAGQLPDALKPCCVPGAYMLAPLDEKYPDPRAAEIPPPPAAPDAATASAPPASGVTTQPAPTPAAPEAPPAPAAAPDAAPGAAPDASGGAPPEPRAPNPAPVP